MAWIATAGIGPVDFQRDRLPFHVDRVSEPVVECLEPAVPARLGGNAAQGSRRAGFLAVSVRQGARGQVAALENRAMKSRRFTRPLMLRGSDPLTDYPMEMC